MAKVSAPLLSFGASGAIAKTQVYSKWKGIPYARQHVIPANPKSADQTKTRNAFSWLNNVFKLMDADAQAPWVAYAKGKPLTARNAMLSFNIATLRAATDISGFVASPGSGGGPGITAAAAPGAAGEATVTITAPTLPTGWAITNAYALLILGQDPQTDSNYTSYTESDNATPWAPAFTAMTAGDYQWSAWLEYTKPDGSVAYSPDVRGTVTIS